MAQLTVTVPDAIAQVISDFWGYNDPDRNPQGLSRAEFARQRLRDYLKLTYRRADELGYNNAYTPPDDSGIQ